MNKVLKKILMLTFIYPIHIIACPKTIFITRHAEKTAHKETITFESWHLSKTKPLSQRGWQRAYALAPHFTLDKELTQYGPIKALFAPKPDNSYNSVRPIQTLTPLAQKLTIKINTEYTLDMSENMIQDIMTNPEYNNQVIWIAYEHHHIPSLTNLFQKHTKATTNKIKIPKTWPDNTFDRIWILEFDSQTSILKNFKNIPQRLLMGDSKI